MVLVLMRGGRMRLSRSGGMRVGVGRRTFFSLRWDGGGVRTVIEKIVSSKWETIGRRVREVKDIIQATGEGKRKKYKAIKSNRRKKLGQT